MAPEVLAKQPNIGLRSDVWSFGVVVWEIYSLGHLPYSSVQNSKLLEHLQSGQRLYPPERTPASMRTLMVRCWDGDPEKRPCFAEIHNNLLGKRLNAYATATPPPLPDRNTTPTSLLA